MPTEAQYEADVLSAVEAGKLKSVATTAELSRLRAAARATAIKDHRVNIRLSAHDLQDIQVRALEDNVPSSRLNATFHAMATLEQLLQSVSDVMFPDELGQATVSLASHGYDGDTALHVFAWRDDTASARVLLEAGADPNARGEMEDTTLHVAITRGNAELAALLLSHGADPELRSAFGSAREVAAESGGAVAKLFGDDD